jgi:hypothetical protein
MNPKRFILAVIAVFIGVFAMEYLVHEVWLKSDYQATMSLWRPKEDMQKHFPFLLAGQALVSLMFVLIWAHADIKTLARGCAFGLCMGLARESTTLITYFAQPIPSEIVVKWFISGLVEGVLMGAVVFLVYGSRPASAPRAA